MDKVIDASFENLEKALSTLINSLATYNPNPAAAHSLVAADASLNTTLGQLSQHQSNHTRIQSLRATSAALDTQIRDTLTLLVQTRQELLNTPATEFPATTNPVKYNELLSYARRIAKFTVPPTYRENPDAPKQSDGDAQSVQPTQQSEGLAQQSQVQTNGNATPIALSNGAGVASSRANSVSTPMDLDTTSATPGPNAAADSQAQPKPTDLPEAYAKWLDPSSETPFFPWPTEDVIRRGALASIQILVDQGIDPATFDPERSAELEAARKAKEEEEDRLRAEARQREEDQRRVEMERRRRESGATGGPEQGAREEKPRVFTGLDLLDDEDEDD